MTQKRRIKKSSQKPRYHQIFLTILNNIITKNTYRITNNLFVLFISELTPHRTPKKEMNVIWRILFYIGVLWRFYGFKYIIVNACPSECICLSQTQVWTRYIMYRMYFGLNYVFCFML